MVKFWFKVGLLAVCLAAVVATKIYLTDIGRSSANHSNEESVEAVPPLEVEMQASAPDAKPAGH